MSTNSFATNRGYWLLWHLKHIFVAVFYSAMRLTRQHIHLRTCGDFALFAEAEA
jgi:hypothetical protein